jgi:dynein heavy chain
LESIFAAGDIKKQLPKESKKFEEVDKSWKDVMKKASDNPSVLRVGATRHLHKTFVNNNKALDEIQKNLENYLESKRFAFPRFYFLSNDELLLIISQSTDPHAVQPHLRKCFDNLVELDMVGEGNNPEIHAMISGEREKIPMPPNLKVRDTVETWLKKVEEAMIIALRSNLKDGLALFHEPSVSRKEWVVNESMSGSLIVTGSIINWCHDVEGALNSDTPVQKMKEYQLICLDDLQDCVSWINGKLTKLQRRCLVALITIDVHAREMNEEMIEEEASNVNDFNWQKQLRMYWDNDAMGGLGDCIVKQTNATLLYGYEYQGCTTRLVITPLTDRCWITVREI